MNALGMFLLGAAVRGAGLVAIAGVVGWAFRRKGPAASAWLGLATLVGMVGVGLLGLSPWPRWEIVGARRDGRSGLDSSGRGAGGHRGSGGGGAGDPGRS